MRRNLVCMFGMGCIFTLAACGVPDDEHIAVLRDLEKCKKTLASTKGELDKTTTERNKLQEDLKAIGGEKNALAQQMGATQKEIEELRKARAAAEARSKVFRQLLARLQSMINSGKLKVEIRKGRMIVKMSDKILFDPGKVKLKEDGQAALKQLAEVLKDIQDRDFLVAGHTDNIPIKTRQFPSNWDLSAARAVQVVKFLQKEGVDPKHLAAAGYSENDPVEDNSTEDGRRSNRRIEIVLMPNIEELPQIDQ